MRKKQIACGVLGLVGAVAASIGTAEAVQYGEADGNDHPHVGLAVFFNAAGQPLWRCSGTMVQDDVFLTAGHCVGNDPASGQSAATAILWFSSEESDILSQGYPFVGDATGTAVPHPNFNGYLTIPNTSDVGVVLLDSPFPRSEYGVVAAEGTLDALATRRGTQDTTFTIVGYGLQSVKPSLSAVRQRRQGTVTLTNLRSALTDGYNVQYTSNPGKGNGEGGTCFGDSGGPIFLGDSNVIVGVNSFVLNLNCKGTAFAYRVDTAYAHDFLESYID